MRLNYISLLQQGILVRLLALLPVLVVLWLLVLWAMG
jgi:hypothetical protein